VVIELMPEVGDAAGQRLFVGCATPPDTLDKLIASYEAARTFGEADKHVHR
jgi:hypothetical protein